MKKNEIIRRELVTTDLHLREQGEGEAESRTIAGYAILFGRQSAPLYEDDEKVVREVISPSAVTASLLDGSDIKMTMFHDRQLILARSNKGQGTLSYSIDEKGVHFEFEAPHTADGDKAIELVKRGDIAGCSFAFSTYYYDEDYVTRESETIDGIDNVTYTVNRMLGVHDFTLAADPAYPETSVEARERELKDHEEIVQPKGEEISAQVAAMRNAAKRKII